MVMPLPITIISGFLGAGKSTLLTALLQNQYGLRLALIVNDLAEVNIDAALVRKAAAVKNSTDGHNGVATANKMIELTNGCMCCALKDDLMTSIKNIAIAGLHDYLIIEGSGVAEPLPVAEAIYSFDIGRGRTLADIVTLDTLVTVVDAYAFMSDYFDTNVVAERPDLIKEMGGKNTMGNHSIVDLLVEQVEFANVLVMNKCDLLHEGQQEQVSRLLTLLNPTAVQIPTSFGVVDPKQLLGSGLFDFDIAEEASGWMQVMNGSFAPKAKGCGIRSFVYRARRPFHPARLDSAIHGAWPRKGDGNALSTVLRSKGFIWLATRHNSFGDWGQAGRVIRVPYGGYWFDAISPDEWPEDDEAQARIKSDFDPNDPTVGDRRQEIVIIGDAQLDEEGVRELLDTCLLTLDEYSLGFSRWASFDDPMELWTLP